MRLTNGYRTIGEDLYSFRSKLTATQALQTKRTGAYLHACMTSFPFTNQFSSLALQPCTQRPRSCTSLRSQIPLRGQSTLFPPSSLSNQTSTPSPPDPSSSPQRENPTKRPYTQPAIAPRPFYWRGRAWCSRSGL